MLGFLSQEDLTAELASAKALVAPSLGGESFGMVLTRAFACATPVVASDITGYRDVMTAETSVAVPPGEPEALADAIAALLEDEPRREALGAAARQLAIERYSWTDIARRLDVDLRVGPRRRDRAGGRVRGIPRSPWLRASLVVPFLAAVVVLLWWRGPDWNVVYHAFDLVNWAWIAFAFGLNLVSVLLRSLAWRLTIDQALDPPHPALQLGLLGLRDRPACERDPAGPDRRARARRGAAPPLAARPRHDRPARRHRLRAPALRSLPGAAARRLRDHDGEDPALGGHEPRSSSRCSASSSSRPP